MRFYLVDRIQKVVPGERIAAVKVVSRLDPVLEEHPVAGCCLASTLALEALNQVSAWLILATSDFSRRGVLGGFRTITVGRPAPVGGRLELRSQAEEWSDEAVIFKSEAVILKRLDPATSVVGDPVIQVEGALCLLIDASKLEDPIQTRDHYQFLQPGADAPADGPGAAPQPAPAIPDHTISSGYPSYDVIQQCVPGELATARKSVAMTDPIFATHFPRFPVMPGVLMMQGIVDLSRALLGHGQSWQPKVFQNVRFRRYVRPGDEVAFTVRLLALSGDEARLSGRAAVDSEDAVVIRSMVLAPAAKG